MFADGHVQAQVFRFVRVSGLAFVSQYLATNGHVPGWWSLWALGAGAAEAGLRQVFPVKPIPAVASESSAPPGAPVA